MWHDFGGNDCGAEWRFDRHQWVCDIPDKEGLAEWRKRRGLTPRPDMVDQE